MNMKHEDIIKKIDFADECNKEVSGNFERTMTITMDEAFLFKELLIQKKNNETENKLSIDNLKLICINDLNNGYTVYTDGIQGLIVQVDDLNDAPKELAKSFEVMIKDSLYNKRFIMHVMSRPSFDEPDSHGDILKI